MSRFASRLIAPLTLFVALLSFSQCEAQERVWVDSSGEFKLTAEFVKFENDTVFLKSTDSETGKVKNFEIGLERLSKDDQQFVKNLMARKKEEKDTESESQKDNKDDKENPKSDDPKEGPMVADSNSDTSDNKKEKKENPQSETTSGDTKRLEDKKRNKPTKEKEFEFDAKNRTPAMNTLDSANLPEKQIRDKQVIPKNLITEVEMDVVSIEPSEIDFKSEIEFDRVENLEEGFREIGLVLYQRRNVVEVGNAFKRLAEKNSPVPDVIIDLLKETADSPNKFFRMQAIRLLALHDAKNSFPKILEAVTDNQSFDVRWTALELVQILKDERAVDLLVERFPGRDRSKILTVLAEYGSSVEEKVLPLLDDDSRTVVIDAMQLISRIGTEKSIPKVETFLDSDNVSIRMQAKSVLKDLNSRLDSDNK